MKKLLLISFSLLLLPFWGFANEDKKFEFIEQLEARGSIDSVINSDDRSEDHLKLLMKIYEYSKHKAERNTQDQLQVIKALSNYEKEILNSTSPKKGFFDLHTNIYLIALIVALILTYVYFKSQKRKTGILLDQMKKDLEKTKKQLSDFNEKIKQEVDEKTKSVNEELEKRKNMDIELKKALKKAEDANYVKSAFLSNMSHEIRTPLNGIIGFSELLLTELSLMENKELYDYANGIRESGDRLLSLLNNIIDISRMEANDMEIQLKACAVNEIIEKTSKLFKFKANEKGIKLNVKFNDIPKAIGDDQSITRVLTYIIDNAIKYTEKGFINVISEFDIESGMICISIKDTGIGIDETYLNHIFEAFRQESLGYSRNYQGAGLGLPLSKRLLDLMNGEILVESKKGGGTTVQIKLRADTNDMELEAVIQEPGTQKGKKEATEKINIFIVEDDRMNRLVLNKMLNKIGNNSLAVDGEETLEIIEKAHKQGLIFDIMLFDINLPAPWDGIILMNEVKEKWPEYKFVPFIAQTAYAMAGDKERLLEAGFDDYIPKPVNKNALINSIYRQLEMTKKNKH